MAVEEIKIDRPAMAAARKQLGTAYEEIKREAAKVRLEDAASPTRRRLSALIAANAVRR
jgi:hypothetical protein